jgi:hypothetical protein
VAASADMRYIFFMNQDAKEILRRVETWPEEDQAELAEVAREIEARRKGIYVLTDDEKAAIEDARCRGFATDEEIAAFWKRHGLA